MRANRYAGALLVGLLVTLFALRTVWIAEHVRALKPVGGGDPAPAFSLPLLSGGTFALAPGEVTLIDFWATWCGPCRAELPHVDAVYQRYKDRGVHVIAVDAEESRMRPQVDSLARALNLSLPIALGGDEAAGLYKVNSLPTLAVIGKDGSIARVLVGVHGEDELGKLLDRQLAE